MNKKHITLTVIVLGTVLLAAVLLWFFSPGIHMIGPWLRMDTTMKVYLFDNETDECVGETYLNAQSFSILDGSTDPTKGFSGTLEIEGYPLDRNANLRSNGDDRVVSVSRSGDFVAVSYDCWGHYYSAEAASSGYIETFHSKYFYYILFYRENPAYMWVNIYERSEHTDGGLPPVFFAVPGETLAEAVSNYNMFMQLYLGEYAVTLPMPEDAE